MGSAFHQLCPRYSGTLTPTAPTANRLWDTFTFFYLQFEEPMSVALPVCVKRTPFGREAVIKIHQSKGRWTELPSADVTFEDNRVGCYVDTVIN